jgi:Zn finger protein HypA/HybF involved in hydrogenase expression
MAQYNGFTCDRCHRVVDPADRTKVTLRFEGKVEGEYHEDRCPDCTSAPIEVPDGMPLKRLRRRGKKAALAAGDITP